MYPVYRTKVRERIMERRQDMKGYAVENGYMGYVDGGYMLFASESDYLDYVS